MFNILATLEQRGYIRALNGTRRFALTTKLYRVGSPAVASLDIKQLLHPLLLELVERGGETVNLAILDGDEAMYIESINGHRACTSPSRPVSASSCIAPHWARCCWHIYRLFSSHFC